MSIREDCLIVRQEQEAARRRLYARLDRELARRTDELGQLYQRGLVAAATAATERKAHRVTVEHRGSGPWQLIGWYAACQCGESRSRGVSTRKLAEQYAADERDWIFRPLLNVAVEHPTSAQEVAS